MLRLTLLSCILGTVITVHPPFETIFEWKYITYNWPSSDSQPERNIQMEYIAEHNAIAGIKLWNNKMYLTIPRWKNGVPVTLAVTSAIPLNGVTAPSLDPYPNWEMQALGNCSALQFVKSMEIDPLGRMWVLDTGRTETMFENPVVKCRPRLVILDLENEGAILRSYEFPDEVASKESAYLNDIVLDHENGGMAFIADAARDDPGIIVYSLKENKAWKVRHDSMKAQEDAISLTIVDTTVNLRVNVHGIALSSPGPNRSVYYSPVSSFHLYSIPASVLKNPLVENIDQYVTDLGIKQSQTDGMVMTNEDHLYMGLLNEGSIALWTLKRYTISASGGPRPVYRDRRHLQWLVTFAIDERGRLWCVTNSLQNFMADRIDKSRPNYRVIRSSTAAKNYQYFANGSAPDLPEVPKLPEITAAAGRVSELALPYCLIIALVFIHSVIGH